RGLGGLHQPVDVGCHAGRQFEPVAARDNHGRRKLAQLPWSARGWRLFVPLTRQAAGILFGEPVLGRDTAGQVVISPRRIAIGQRFVVLVPDGWRPSPTPVGPVRPDRPKPSDGGRKIVRASEANLTLDLPAGAATLFIYLNETDTQSVAA